MLGEILTGNWFCTNGLFKGRLLGTGECNWSAAGYLGINCIGFASIWFINGYI